MGKGTDAISHDSLWKKDRSCYFKRSLRFTISTFDFHNSKFNISFKAESILTDMIFGIAVNRPSQWLVHFCILKVERQVCRYYFGCSVALVQIIKSIGWRHCLKLSRRTSASAFKKLTYYCSFIFFYTIVGCFDYLVHWFWQWCHPWNIRVMTKTEFVQL